MLGFFPIAGSPLASSGDQLNTNKAEGTGVGTGTAAGRVIGAAAGTGVATGVAAGRVVGNADGTGVGTGTAMQSLANGVGSELDSAAGQVVGRAIGTGVGTGVAAGWIIGPLAIGIGEGVGTATAFYPLYTAWEKETPLFTYAGAAINELDAAFEQAGRVVVCAERTIQGQPEIWVYWFNPTLGSFAFEKKALGRNPRCILDDPFDTTNSDVLIFYVRIPDQRICYRRQRDRYDTEFETPVVKVKASYVDVYLQDVVKDRSGRLVVIYALHDIAYGRWSYGRLESSLYPYILEFDSFKAAKVDFLNTSTFRSAVLTVRVFGEVPDTVPDGWLSDEEFTTGTSFVSGLVQQPIKEVGPPGSTDPIGAPVPFYNDVDKFQLVDSAFQSGSIVVVIKDTATYDVDEFTLADAFQSGSLNVVVIVVVLFDVDQFTLGSTFQAAGSSLA